MVVILPVVRLVVLSVRARVIRRVQQPAKALLQVHRAVLVVVFAHLLVVMVAPHLVVVVVILDAPLLVVTVALRVVVTLVVVDARQGVVALVVVGALRVVLDRAEAIALVPAAAPPNKAATRVQRLALKTVHTPVTKAVQALVIILAIMHAIINVLVYVTEPVLHRAKEAGAHLVVPVCNRVM